MSYSSPTALDPLLPRDGDLRDLALDLAQKSARLAGALTPEARRAVTAVLRLVNCYYSNLIEGHRTELADIERAMAQEYSPEDRRRVLQLESRAHVEVQDLIAERLDQDPGLDPCRTEFLDWVHGEFYTRLPEELRFVEHRDGQTREPVVPGQLRHRAVTVGRHLAPDHEALPAFMRRFEDGYDFSKIHGDHKLLAIAASHHRLVFIHPYLDGNGRVARLFTDTLLAKHLLGHGLWTVSRGLARRREEYYAALAGADSPRRGDYDGRGNLSQKALDAFCRFFLEICLDQIEYMGRVLTLDGLYKRVEAYLDYRISIPLLDRPLIRRELKGLVLQALVRGHIPRNLVAEITGLGYHTARKEVGKLVKEGLLVADTSRAPLRWAVPVHALDRYFPDL